MAKNRIAVGARANGALQVNNDDLMKVSVPLPTGSQSLSEQKLPTACLRWMTCSHLKFRN